MPGCRRERRPRARRKALATRDPRVVYFAAVHGPTSRLRPGATLQREGCAEHQTLNDRSNASIAGALEKEPDLRVSSGLAAILIPCRACPVRFHGRRSAGVDQILAIGRRFTCCVRRDLHVPATAPRDRIPASGGRALAEHSVVSNSDSSRPGAERLLRAWSVSACRLHQTAPPRAGRVAIRVARNEERIVGPRRAFKRTSRIEFALRHRGDRSPAHLEIAATRRESRREPRRVLCSVWSHVDFVIKCGIGWDEQTGGRDVDACAMGARLLDAPPWPVSLGALPLPHA